jgi:hypothetical protein
MCDIKETTETNEINYNPNYQNQSKDLDDFIEILNIVREGLKTKHYEAYYNYIKRLVKFNDMSNSILENELKQSRENDSSDDETYINNCDEVDSVSEYSEDSSGEEDINQADNKAYIITEFARRNISMSYTKVFDFAS